MRVDSPQFTADAHAGDIAKSYGFYNNTCNIRHHVGKPVGEPAMIQKVKVDEIISINKYLANLHPRKRYSC